MIITYDSKKVIAITKKDDAEQYVRQFDLESYDQTFTEMIGGKETSYIKIKEVEQTSDGKKYAVVYNDDGHFYMRTFEQTSKAGGPERTPEEIKDSELDINKLIDCNNHTMCNQTFPDPFITCTFLT